MRRMARNYLLALLALGLSYFSFAHACTDIVVKAQSDDIIVGRTLEFGPNLHSNIVTSNRGAAFSSKTPDGKSGKSWKAKYGYIFMDFFGVVHPSDGLNEKGLSFGYLYFPGYSEYPKVEPGKESQAVSYIMLGDWILGNFATVDEVKNALQNITVFAEPMDIESHRNVILPLHAVITDASGKSITIEFIKGKMYVDDNSVGILTNSPPFNWQLVNLKNFSNLSPHSPKTINIDGFQYSGTGQGAGAVGLPGDFSPPSRFVKMMFLLQTAYPVADAIEALNLAEHILNDVDIPKGAVRGVTGSNAQPDTTQWTVFKDLKNHILYFKSYTNTNLQAIDLDKLDLSEGAAQLKMPIKSPQAFTDVTQKYSQTAKR